MKKYRKNYPKNRKETGIAIRTWFLSFFIIMIIFSIVLPEDETGHTSIPAYCSFVAFIAPTVFALLNINKKGKSLLSFGKSFVVGFITWFALTGLFVYIDSQSHLSDLTEWYAPVGIFFPIIAAVFIALVKPISLLKRAIDNKVYGLKEYESVDCIIDELAESLEKDFTKTVSLNIEQKPEIKDLTPKQPIDVTEDMHAAAQIIFKANCASVSMVQKRLLLGYSRAARLIDNLELSGVIGPFNGSSPRKFLISEEEYLSRYRIVDTFQYDSPDIEEKEIHIDYTDIIQVDCANIIQEEEEWRRQQMGISSFEYELRKIDGMDGHEFEHWCAELLKKNRFTDIEVTKGSGDQGVDVLAVKDGIHYAIQCKCYSSKLGNGPVQEVHAGKSLYRCQVGVVMTNQYFTAGAKELATATGVLLWDRDKLATMLEDCI